MPIYKEAISSKTGSACPSQAGNFRKLLSPHSRPGYCLRWQHLAAISCFILSGPLFKLIPRLRLEIFVSKALPDAEGQVEIGYALYPELENRGFMTEAVEAFCCWAFAQHSVKAILAETDLQNIASQKVLTKNAFSYYRQIGDWLWWRLDKPDDETTIAAGNENRFSPRQST